MAERRRSAKDAFEQGDLEGVRILIVEARFYEDIADALLVGATRVLKRAGAASERGSVPGALEVAPAIAIAVDAAERSGRPYDGASRSVALFAARRCISRSWRRNQRARCS